MAVTQTEVDKQVRRFIERVQEHVTVTHVYMFGSYAKGIADEHSDIDLAVVSPDFGEDRREDLVLLSRSRLPDSLRIEALPFTLQEHEKLPPGSFPREVRRNGRLVYEG